MNRTHSDPKSAAFIGLFVPTPLVTHFLKRITYSVQIFLQGDSFEANFIACSRPFWLLSLPKESLAIMSIWFGR